MRALATTSSRTLLAFIFVVAAATPVAAASEASPKAAQRCTTENVERTVKGQLQRCVPNARGVLRWLSLDSARETARVLQIQGTDPLRGYVQETHAVMVAAMKDGTALVGGGFYGSVSLGSFTVSGNRANFLARVSPILEWTQATLYGSWGATPYWGSSYDSTFGPVVALSDGSAIVTGTFCGRISLGTTTFDSSCPLSDSLDGFGIPRYIFYGRLMPDGSWAWVKNIGGVGGSEIRSAVETADGLILLSGWFRNVNEKVRGMEYESGNNTLFLRLIDRDGNTLATWVPPVKVNPLGTPDTYGAWLDLKVASALSDGTVLLVGDYCGTITIGSVVIPTENKYKGGFKCGAFVGRFRQDFSFVWLRELQQIGAEQTGSSGIGSVTAMANGDMVLTGSVSKGQWKFGKSNVKLDSGTTFVARIDARGNWRWVRSVSESPWGVEATPDNGVVIIGEFKRTLKLGKSTITSRQGYDGFIAKMNASGEWVWLAGTDTITVKEPGVSTRFDDLTVTPDGTILVAGTMTGTVRFGSTSVKAPGVDDQTGFVARLSPDGVWK